MKGISLFSCAGIGEFFLDQLDIDFVVANDIDPVRCKTYNYFHKNTKIIVGDITKQETKKQILDSVKNENIEFLLATPPCQGMSSVGKNRKDNSLQFDIRNSLVLESIDIIDKTNPTYILFENVPRFLKVKYLYLNEYLTIVEVLEKKFGNAYNIKVDIFNSADFEIPQTRNRVFIRLFKKGTNWKDPNLNKKHISLEQAIGHLPSLESGEKSKIKNHWARSHPKNQIDSLMHTKTGYSALNNKFHYPRNKNKLKVKGYGNCYRRIDWDRPAPTVTMRNEIISSQNNVHPGRLKQDGTYSDARVLTMRELLIIMSLPPDLDVPNNISDTKIRQLIGEGIPPKMVYEIVKEIFK